MERVGWLMLYQGGCLLGVERVFKRWSGKVLLGLVVAGLVVLTWQVCLKPRFCGAWRDSQLGLV